MPFLKQLQLDQLKAFWKVNPTPPGLIISSDGSKWPDFLGHGGGSPRFFVSEQVINSLLSAKVLFSRLTEMPIAKIESLQLKLKVAPKYFVVETQTGIAVDFQASKIPTDAAGKPVLDPLPKPWPPKIKVRASSWNGMDVFDYANFGQGPFLNVFCTPKIKDMAEKAGWTNISFHPMETI